MSEEKHVSLFYCQGNSDKEYHVHLVKQGSGFMVRIEYGRRGSSLSSSNKTPIPVDLDKASKIFNDAVHSKKLKGYTEGAGQVPYVGGDKENKITGLLPQLLNLIEEEDLDDYFDDPNFCMQEKKDGKRILLRRQDGVLEAINRKGLLVGFPQSIQDRLEKIDESFVIDGELIGDVFFVFDALELAGTDCRALGYSNRYSKLESFLEPVLSLEGESGQAIQLVPALFKPSEKRKAFKKYKAQGVEGVVFKRVDAPYKAGRPASGGDQLKFKFTETCTCQVSGINEKGKRSVYIQALDGSKLVDVGKVTILPNFAVPTKGTLVEVKYLYRHVHGALYQPVYLGERDDLEVPDQVSTLKIKEGIDVDEEES